MNNTIINSKENIYSIENLSNICYKKSLDLLVQSIEQLDNNIKESKDRKVLFDIKGFYKRTIVTTQGTITYKRRLYIDKKTGEYIFLVDKLIGVDKYSRLTDEAIKKVVETAIELKSYSVAGKYALNGTIISRQTVYNCISKVEITSSTTKVKIKVPVIHIAIDGFCVNYKNSSRKYEIKFANIYTGIEQITHKKRKLLNRFIVTQTNKLNFKEKLLKVIYDNFDITDETKFYICGDGATWIESLTEYFPNSTFVIDKFHYIRALTHLPDPETACASFFNRDIESLATQISLCENDLQKEYLSYVIKHFNQTKPWHNSDYICCAAENVVSHVFNNRMRSIPRTWGCNIFKMSSGLALMNTNNLDISLTSVSDDKLLNKYNSISDLFTSISFVSPGSNLPILSEPVNIKSQIIRAIANGVNQF